MKILSISSVYPNSAELGLGLFVRSRLQHLAASAEVKVIAPIPLLDWSNARRNLFHAGKLPLRRQDGAIEVYHPRWLFPPGGTPTNVVCLFLRLLPFVYHVRRTFPFDLIDAHFGYPEGAAASLLAAIFRLPYTITLRGSETVFASYRYRRRLLRWAMRRASHIIAVSDNLRSYAIEEGVPPESVTTIPNGIEAEVFHLRDQHEMRRRHGCSPGRRLILSAGELIEAKGHHLAIRALKNLMDRGYDLDLMIVGSTARGGKQYEDQLRDLVAELGLKDRVRFAGWVDRANLAELLSAADILCLASFTEGWPNVVHEALACGTPVVASDVGGIPAMLSSEQYGFVVPPKNDAELTEALDRALRVRWDRKAISAWGCSRTWIDVAREVAAIHRNILGCSAQPTPEVLYNNVRH
jgi:teichuronic acid biosynthesis glycosyltransferase TuaC